MGFVLKKHWQRTSAFGELCVPLSLVKSDIRRVFANAKKRIQGNLGPTTDFRPLNHLRGSMLHALRLDVVLHPKARFNTESKYWELSPVWKVANNNHLKKAIRISSLMHSVIKYGYASKIEHDLLRLSSAVWSLTMSNFYGLCRRIFKKIKVALLERSKSPETIERIATLTIIPALSDGVFRQLPKKKRNSCFPRRCPVKLELLVTKLNRFRKKHASLTCRCLHDKDLVHIRVCTL